MAEANSALTGSALKPNAGGAVPLQLGVNVVVLAHFISSRTSPV